MLKLHYYTLKIRIDHVALPKASLHEKIISLTNYKQLIFNVHDSIYFIYNLFGEWML